MTINDESIYKIITEMQEIATAAKRVLTVLNDELEREIEWREALKRREKK